MRDRARSGCGREQSRTASGHGQARSPAASGIRWPDRPRVGDSRIPALPAGLVALGRTSGAAHSPARSQCPRQRIGLSVRMHCPVRAEARCVKGDADSGFQRRMLAAPEARRSRLLPKFRLVDNVRRMMTPLSDVLFADQQVIACRASEPRSLGASEPRSLGVYDVSTPWINSTNRPMGGFIRQILGRL